MKILMSAFACCPGRGSEPGIGWNWAVEAARQGHEVEVVTQACDRADIEREISRGGVPANLKFTYFMPGWLERLRRGGMKPGLEGLTWLIVHMLWQIAVYGHLRRRDRIHEFDIVHHITYGGVRHPTLLGRLPVPLVLGPLGGGDVVPFALRRSFGWGSWLKELLRDTHNRLLRFDPVTRGACDAALAIYVKTSGSWDILPRGCRDKASVRMEVGTYTTAVPERAAPRAGSLRRLMFAGRFLDLKGMHLGLRALAKARSRGLDVRLTMVGEGPAEARWRRLAEKLDLCGAVDWRGWVPHGEIGALYTAHDALLFPSLRDSSGNVVLEALVNGLPVICLELGGPAHLVTNRCGRVVPVAGCGERECVEALTRAIIDLAGNDDGLQEASSGAAQRARDFYMPAVVRGLYRDVERRLKLLPGIRLRPDRRPRPFSNPAARASRPARARYPWSSTP